MEQVLRTQGSLELFIHRTGFLMVRFADWYDKGGYESLKKAREYHMIGAERLNGSQAATVKGWRTDYLQGAFDAELDAHAQKYAGKEVF